MISLISLPEVADLIEASQVTRHDDHASSVRLDLQHPTEGALTIIQSGAEAHLIRHAQAEAAAK